MDNTHTLTHTSTTIDVGTRIISMVARSQWIGMPSLDCSTKEGL